MAFTRNFLKTMNLTDEQVNAIIEEHTNVTDALKAQRDKAVNDAKDLKEKADKVPELEKQLEAAQGGEDFKAKWEKEHQDFEDYKANIAKEQQTEKAKAAYRKLLSDENINEKHIDLVMRKTDFSNMKIDKDGNLENLDGLKKAISDDWNVFKVTKKERKQDVSTPPKDGGTGSGMSRAKELAMKFQQERYGIKSDAGKE